MHCVHWPAQSITRRLAGEKALSQGGCFLVLPALLFQWAPVRPYWWTLWSSLAGSFGILFNLPSPPSAMPPTPPPSTFFYLHLSLFHSPHVFTSTFLCPSSVVHSFLTMMTTVPAWILPCKVAWPSETSHTPFEVSGLLGCWETWIDDYSMKTNAGSRR